MSRWHNGHILRILINFTGVIIMVYVLLMYTFAEKSTKPILRREYLSEHNSTSIWQGPRDVLQDQTSNTSSVPTLTTTVKLNIGILIPTTTLGLKNTSLSNLSLTTLCLPSLFKSMENNYTYKIYLGINQYDILRNKKANIEAMFKGVEVIRDVTSWSFCSAVNNIARKACKDGMDYLVRITDDTVFTSNNWTTLGVNVLRGFHPPNVGVVGPTCLDGNTAILTHDMVHRTHFKIFGFYYHPFFENWYADDWITAIYRPERMFKIPSWVIKHRRDLHGQRYHVEFFRAKSLKKIVPQSKQTLDVFIANMTEH